MRCKYCPAYWEDIDYWSGHIDDWGCYCNPKAKDCAGREFKDGTYGCNRTKSFVEKVMKKMNEEKCEYYKREAIKSGISLELIEKYFEETQNA